MISLRLTFFMLMIMLVTACETVNVNYSDKSRVLGNISNIPPKIDTLINLTYSEAVAITPIDVNDGGDDFDGENQPLTYSCYFENIINGSLDLPVTSCSSLPGIASFDSSTGAFTWTPDYTANGIYELWFTASDGNDFDREVVTFTITNINQAPILDNVTGPITGTVSAPITAINLNDAGNDTDADGDVLTYSCFFDTNINGSFDGPGTNCSALSGTVSFNTSTGVLNWTPDASASGNYEVMFSVSDGSLTDSQLVSMTIQDNTLGDFVVSGVTGGGDVTPDDELNFTTYPVINWTASTTATGYDVTIFESNGTTPVSCGVATAVVGTSYNFSSCALTPGSQYRARVTARSGIGGSKNASNDLYSFRLNANPVAANDGPYYVLGGGNISVSVLTDNLATVIYDPDTDADGDPLSISSRTNGTKGTTNISGGDVVYTAGAGQAGMDTFTYTISDGRGGTATGTVTIFVISGYSWLGAVNSDWNNPGNWCGSINANKTSCAGGTTLPGPTDAVNFNSSCINCNVNINQNVSVRQFKIDADFTGTINQNTHNIALSEGWTQNAGTFVGGSGSINVNRFFNLTAGTFTSTTGEFVVYRDQGCCGFTPNTFVIYGAAGFIHNNGTVKLSGRGSNGTGHTIVVLEVNAANVTFYNLIVDSTDADGTGGYDDSVVQLISGQTLYVLNKFTQADGKLASGRIYLSGDAEFSCLSPQVCSDGGGHSYVDATELIFNTAFPLVHSVTIKGTASLPSITLSGTSTVNVISDSGNMPINGNFKQTDGVFNAPSGWISIDGFSISHTTDNPEGFRVLGGVFNDNGCSLSLHGSNRNSAAGLPKVGTLQVPLGFTVRHFLYSHWHHISGSSWDLGLTNILNVTEDFTHEDGWIYGTPTFNVGGNVFFGCTDALVCAESNNTRINLIGGGTQAITQEMGAGIAQGHWTVNKPSGHVSFLTDLVLDGADQDFDLVSSTIEMNGYNFTLKDSTPGGNILTLGPNTVINRGLTPGTIDTDTINQDPSALINPP